LSVLVIGSMNMDLVVQTDRVPEKGETVIGNTFNQIPGGKGANQAVCLGKLKTDVGFIGACGTDNMGSILLDNLEKNNVDTENVFKIEGNSGIALITVDGERDNRIILVQGANGKLEDKMIDSVEKEIEKAEIILLQLEIPLKTVIHTIKLAKKYNCQVILDPAPARPLPQEIYPDIDYLLPNQGELDILLKDRGLSTEKQKAEQLLKWGVGSVIVTKGEDGLMIYSNKGSQFVKAIQVDPVDTTAAGDAFAGAFTYGLLQKWSLNQAIVFGNVVAALSVTRFGAQSSLPDLEDVESFIKERGISY